MKLLSLQRAARILRCSEEKVSELIERGVIPAIKPGKPWLIPQDTFYAAISHYAEMEAEQRRLQAASNEAVIKVRARADEKMARRPGTTIVMGA